MKSVGLLKYVWPFIGHQTLRLHNIFGLYICKIREEFLFTACLNWKIYFLLLTFGSWLYACFFPILIQIFFLISFVITIEFRSILPNGLLFYISNQNKTNLQYISLELVDGVLKYQFDAGIGNVSMKTDKKYNTGEWFMVSPFLYFIWVSLI